MRFSENEMIGEYRVTAFLGAGGMGEVYQGVHAKLGRAAAIKVLGETASDASFSSRFFNEARLQASLHHPNIATLYDFQEIGGRLCIFMEMVDGESLEDLIAQRAFAVEDAMRIFASVVEAVAFIHQNRILHRDIKSQNIKLNSRGTIKLLDFGIAKDATSHSLTQVGGVIGTPSYLAPEQLDGKGATAQTDIWALGILLYEMLTGIEPFKADTIGALCMQITLGNFVAPEKINPAVPREVSRIVARCLKKNVAERYQTADDLLEDVKHLLSGAKPQKNAALSGLKKSLVFTPKNALSTPTNFSPSQTSESFYQNTSEDNSYQNDSNNEENYQNSASGKKLPVAAIAVAASVAVVLLFGVVGIGVWSMSSSSAGNSAGNSISTIGADSKNSKNIIVQSAAQSSSAQRRVRVDVDEGSAQVFRDGQTVGTTPFDLEANEGELVNLTLKRDGFEDKNVQIEVTSRKQVYTFSLKPK